MTGTTNMLRFILNDEEIAISDIKATETLLDYLRLTKRLKGSKEGCADGASLGAVSVPGAPPTPKGDAVSARAS